MAAVQRIDAPLLNRHISQAPGPDALLALHDAHGWQMDSMHHGNLWNKLGKSRRSAVSGGAPAWTASCTASLERLVHASVSVVDTYGPQQLANVAHGAALAGVSGTAVHALYSSLSARALTDGAGAPLDRFEPRHLANFAWGFATAGHTPKALFKAIAKASRPLLALPTAPAEDASYSSGGKGRGEGKGSGGRGSGRGRGGCGGAPTVGFNDQELAMLAFAFSKAGHGSLSVPLAEHVRKESSSVSPSQLAALAPSLVRLATQTSVTDKQRAALTRALKALARAARTAVRAMGPLDLEMAATAYARLGLSGWGTQLTKAIATAAVDAIGGTGGGKGHVKGYGKGGGKGGGALAPRQLTNLLWAVAKLASNCRIASGKVATDAEVVSLAEAAGREIAIRLEGAARASFNARDLSNAAWALLTLGLVDRRCLEAIGRAAAPIIASFNAQECSKLLGSLSKARVHVAELDAAASALRELTFDFASPVGDVCLQHSVGGGRSLGGGAKREGTGATAATGFALWEDAFVLAEWLSRVRSPATLSQPDGGGIPPGMVPPSLAARASWRGVCAVELGAGIGLCAVTAARLGMRVVATDGDARTVELIASNLERNQAEGRAVGLRWGAADVLGVLGLGAKPELVLATGCVYGSSAQVWDELVATLDELAGPDTLVLLVHGNGTAPGTLEMRGEFYARADKLFHVARVPQQVLHGEHDGCRVHCLLRRA